MSWIQYFSAFGSVATPILVIILTGVGWKYRQSIERTFKLEEKLRDDRIDIYNKILDPFIILLMTDAAWESDKKNRGKSRTDIGISQALSLEYRRTSFKLILIGSDSVVLAFNDMFQYFYDNADLGKKVDDTQTVKLLLLLGDFLLEIRKSMGNEATVIDGWGMLEPFITDARKYRELDDRLTS